MKKLSVVLVLAVCLSITEAGAFGFFNFFRNNNQSVPAANQNYDAAINLAAALADMQAQTSSVDARVQNCWAQIASQLASSSQNAQDLNSKINNMFLNNYGKTSSEQYSKMERLMSEYILTLKNNKQNVANVIKNMTDSQKATLVNNIINLATSGQDYVNIAKNGAAQASKMMKASNRAAEIISNINTINTLAGEIKDRAKTSLMIANQLRSIVQSAGVRTY